MENAVRALCLMSVFCGAALSLCPEGGVKRIMSILSASILLISLLSPLRAMDFSSYALESAKLREREEEISRRAGEMSDSLNRMVIQRESEAYIMDKAAELGLEAEVKLELRWSSEGLWVPAGAEISCSGDRDAREELKHIIEAELGIPAQKQKWSQNG